MAWALSRESLASWYMAATGVSAAVSLASQAGGRGQSLYMETDLCPPGGAKAGAGAVAACSRAPRLALNGLPASMSWPRGR